MATSTATKKKCVKSGGVIGAIVPVKPKVDSFPLMSFVANNCSFQDDSQYDCLESEEALKAENRRRFEDLLKQAALSAKEKYEHLISSQPILLVLYEHFNNHVCFVLSRKKECVPSDDEESRKKALEVMHSLELARNKEDTWKVPE